MLRHSPSSSLERDLDDLERLAVRAVKASIAVVRDSRNQNIPPKRLRIEDDRFRQAQFLPLLFRQFNHNLLPTRHRIGPRRSGQLRLCVRVHREEHLANILDFEVEVEKRAQPRDAVDFKRSSQNVPGIV